MTQSSEPEVSNRLGTQDSGYLLAHAHDPINWRPWGKQALKRAVRLDRPVFLSIGYQSCHWCHVMQRESFLDPDLAGFLNRHFVCVKVDRELRPDIDAFYQMYIGATTGKGGWPLSAFLLPDGAPFFGGTYFPGVSPHAESPSFRHVTDSVMRTWVLERETAFSGASQALELMRNLRSSAIGPLGEAEVGRALETVYAMLDLEHGGLGLAPKFPQTPVIDWLIASYASNGDLRLLEAARSWVLAMLRGGIFDQVGGGLFRYSTDRTWTVPHFEKMLCDQGLLLSTLASLHAVDPAEEYRIAAMATVEFLSRELAREGGGFFSSLDADTNGIEGATYVWTREELSDVLTPAQLLIAETRLGVSEDGNWHAKANVLNRRDGRAEDAEAVDAVLRRLAEARSGRPQPAVITNTITAWNAIAARGLIEAGAAFSDSVTLELGTATLDWLLGAAVRGDELLRSPDDRSVASLRFLEDYAAVTAACLAAVDHAGRHDLLKPALLLQRSAVARFGVDGGFAMSAGDDSLPFVPLETADTPAPSGASMLAENALLLARLTADASHTRVATGALAQFGRTASVAPHLAGHALRVAGALARRLSYRDGSL